MPEPARYTATCPKAVERLLAGELTDLGAADVREGSAAVTFSGPLTVAYRACLWSRVASRVLLVLAESPAATADDLYEGVRAIPWEDHVSPDGTIAVDAAGTTPALTHTGFTARRVKDAIVDRIRDVSGRRPSVDLDRPDVRVNVRLHKSRATVSIDLSGEPLHRRGYRSPGEQAAAPLKENLAAAVLLRAGWPDIAAGGGTLLDPMCGSGTLLLEGALIAGDAAPGSLRTRWGFDGWLGHDADAWAALLDEADGRADAGRARMPLIAGSDADPDAVALAVACAGAAGLRGAIRLDVAGIGDLRPPRDGIPGLVVTNPPYGVRIGDAERLKPLYAQLGERLAQGFSGWRAAVLTPDADLARATGLRSTASHRLYNGAIETRLYVIEVSEGAVRAEVRRAPATAAGAAGADATEFANRLRKNARHLAKWARREDVTCLRVYDADLPDFAVAVDVYEDAEKPGRRLAHVQEYAPPAGIDPARAEARLAAAVATVPEVLGVDAADIFVKERRRQRGAAQYERTGAAEAPFRVREGGLLFEIDLAGRLDSGLFLDHRPVRARVRELARGKRFCNLFAYTGTATVHAAAGGAAGTTTVDLSSGYLARARRNLRLNGFAEGATHVFVRADALEWVRQRGDAIAAGAAEPFDLVLLDPPTFSNSKRMGERTFDVQRDHVALLGDAVRLLAPGGLLLFSCNARRFRLDDAALSGLDITDVSASTVPPDFARTPDIHRCYEVRVRQG